VCSPIGAATLPRGPPVRCRSSSCRSATRGPQRGLSQAGRRASEMAPLRHPSFRLLLAGELISNFGDGIFLVALPWYVLAHHGGALLLGTILTAYGVPRTALLIVGGHASDRYRPWTVMLAANCARGLAVTAFVVTAATGTAHGPVLTVIAIVLGAGEGMFIPRPPQSFRAAASRRAPGRQRAHLRNHTTQPTRRPRTRWSARRPGWPADSFAIDATTFAVSALTLAGVRRDAPRPTTTAHPTNPAGNPVTLRDVLGQPIVRLMLVTDALVNLGSTGMSRVALPALAKGPCACTPAATEHSALLWELDC